MASHMKLAVKAVMVADIIHIAVRMTVSDHIEVIHTESDSVPVGCTVVNCTVAARTVAASTSIMIEMPYHHPFPSFSWNYW